MSIASEITRLQGAKADIKTAIEAKGVTVPSAASIDTYGTYVGQISAGGTCGHTGTVDTAGLQLLVWDAQDIQWLQDHVWWDAADDAVWAVSAAEKAYGPTGATPITWATRADIKFNQEVRFLPKLTPSGTSFQSIFSGYRFLKAIPTHGWNTANITTFNSSFYACYTLRSVGNIGEWDTGNVTTLNAMFQNCYYIEDVGDLDDWDLSKNTALS